MKKIATPRTALAAGIAKVLKRLHYPLDVMLLCVRWYVAYSLSLRDLEEMMAERAIGVDHSTVHRWGFCRSKAGWTSKLDCYVLLMKRASRTAAWRTVG